jgi:hypothetical protein
MAPLGGSRIFAVAVGFTGGCYLRSVVGGMSVPQVKARHRIRQEPGPVFVELGPPAFPLADVCFTVIVK